MRSLSPEKLLKQNYVRDEEQAEENKYEEPDEEGGAAGVRK